MSCSLMLHSAKLIAHREVLLVKTNLGEDRWTARSVLAGGKAMDRFERPKGLGEVE